MSTLILLMAITAFLAGLIYFLHRLQIRKSGELADQTAPLPPLDAASSLNSASEPVNVTDSPATSCLTAMPWQEEVKQLRDNGQFQAALSLCKRQYPRMLAFRQTMITLRSSLNEGQQEEETLQAIYRAAIQAELARHQKTSQETGNIQASLDLPDDTSHYWPNLGYEKLPLLTKTDLRRMVARWGEPKNHNLPEQILTSTHRQDIFHG